MSMALSRLSDSVVNEYMYRSNITKEFISNKYITLYVWYGHFVYPHPAFKKSYMQMYIGILYVKYNVLCLYSDLSKLISVICIFFQMNNLLNAEHLTFSSLLFMSKFNAKNINY